MSDQRTLIVWDRIGDYHRARVRAFEKLVGKETVFTADLGAADKLYGWEGSADSERHFILSEKPVDTLDIRTRVRAFRKLIKDKKITQLALAGYAHPEYLVFLVIGRMAGCRIILFAESWYGEQAILNFCKGLFLKTFAHAFFVSGQRAREHFSKRLGIPEYRILCKYSVVDNQHFSKKDQSAREPVLLCVARFSPEKNLPRLMKAFRQSRLSETHTLRIIGGGPDKAVLEGLTEDHARIELLDWVDYADLPDQYAAARFFILPSLFEPWGLVINEAMAAGLPVVASSACGCVPDIVTSANGFVFKAEDDRELIGRLNQLALLSDAEWEELSAASGGIISEYQCEDWAKQLGKGFLIDANN